jgi:hypothetical protein
LVKKNNQARTEILIKCSNLDNEQAIREDHEFIKQYFFNWKLEDKLMEMRRVMSSIQLAPTKEEGLGVVRVQFEFKRNGSTKLKEMGCTHSGPIEEVDAFNRRCILSVIVGPAKSEA